MTLSQTPFSLGFPNSTHALVRRARKVLLDQHAQVCSTIPNMKDARKEQRVVMQHFKNLLGK